MTPPLSGLLDALNLAGTFAFALSGASVAIDVGMDIFGVLVLAFVTSVAGGVFRDVIIGVIPPAAFQNWHVLALSVAAAILAFGASRFVLRLQPAVQLFDAAGLGIFAVSGTQIALIHKIDPVMAGALGLVTGIGGGIVRDVLSGTRPMVLVTGFYASAAIAGIVLLLVAQTFHLGPSEGIDIAAVATCVALRVLAISGDWKLPSAKAAASTRPG